MSMKWKTKKEKINEIKGWFFDKLDKSLLRLLKRERERNCQYHDSEE